MQQKLINIILSTRRRRIVMIAQKTLVSIFPFLLIATIVLVISEAVFNEGGYINNLFKVSSWFPRFNLIDRVTSNLISLLGGLTATITAYFAAKYTARAYERSAGTAGITALIFSLIVNSRELFAKFINDGELTRINLPVNFNLFIAICIGYLIGQIFRLLSPAGHRIIDDNYVYHPRTGRPVFVSIAVAVLCNALISLGTRYNVFSYIGTVFSNFFKIGSGVRQVAVDTVLRSVSAWVGNSSVYNEIGFISDPDAIINLNSALGSGTTSSIPKLFTDTNLYAAYGGLAGLGGTLALIVAILWKSASDKDQNIGIRSIFPALFNHGVPAMVGIPVFLNLIYLVPFIVVPLVNVLLAAVLLYFKIVPPAVYPVPAGTPNILYAFVGTAGSIRALTASIVLFVLDILIYVQFVKLDNRVHEMLLKEDMDGKENRDEEID